MQDSTVVTTIAVNWTENVPELAKAALPVAASFLHNYLKKASAWISELSDAAQRLAYVAITMVLAMAGRALNLVLPGNIEALDVSSIESILLGVMGLVIYRLGRKKQG